MKELFKKKWFLEVLFIFLLSLTPLLWFKQNTLIVGHDNVFGLNPKVFLEGRLTTWADENLGQNQSLIMGTIPIHFIDAIPSFLGFPTQSTEKIVYVFWFFMIGLSAYILASILQPESRVFKLTASTMYQFNFFLLQGWWIGERTKFSAYCLFPIVLAIFISVYRGRIRILRAGLMVSLLALIFNGGGLYGIPLYGGFFVGIGLFILFFSFLSIIKKDFPPLLRTIKLTIVSICGATLINSYFIFPAVSQLFSTYKSTVASNGGASGFVDWASEISAFASYTNIFRLQGIAEWYDNRFHPYAAYFLHNPLLILISFLWPALVFLSIYLYRKHKKIEIILYLFLVYIVGIVFTSGTHPPLGFLYIFLIQHVPGFVIFRSPYYKFAPAVFLSSSFLIAYSLDFLRGPAKKVFFLLFLLILLGYHFPFFTGNIFSFGKDVTTRVEVPSYVWDFGAWLNNQKADDARVLVLPPNDPALRYGVYKWGFLSYQDLSTLVSNKSVVINNDRVNNQEQALVLDLYSAIASNNTALANKLFSILDIGYAVVQNDKTLSTTDTLPFDKSDYEKFVELNGTKIKTFGEWSVYKLTNKPLPTFFTGDSINILSAGPDSIKDYFSSSNNLLFSLQSGPEFSMISNGTYYVPDCVNCPNDQNKPLITFPEPSILPGSPLYPFVLFREKMSESKNPTNRVYDDIGFSLKRLSEIQALGVRDGTVKADVLTQFDDLLKKTYTDFNQIPAIEDKIRVAGDLDYYMHAEQEFLLKLENTLNTGNPLALDYAKVDQSISTFRGSIDPYLYKLNSANNRLYKLTINTSGQFDFLLDKNSVSQVSSQGAVLHLSLDDAPVRDIKLDPTYQDQWISFGQHNLSSGVHYLSLSFPQSSNLAGSLSAGKVDFSSQAENNCFISRINNYEDHKLYKVTIDYKNDFAADLVFYIWEQRGSAKRILNVAKLSPGLTNQQYYQYERSPGDNSELWAGVCSGGLNKDIVSSRINMTAEEILFPSLMFVPVADQNPKIQEISYKKISSTKYEVTIPKHDTPITLNFMEQFDKGWKLSQFNQSHFESEGYANGWVIAKGDASELTVEYAPENFFRFGLVISSLSLLFILGYLFKIRNKKHE